MTVHADSQLLRAYAGEGSETAFAELVHRHSGLVYSTALRSVGDPSLAQDVSQGVFVAVSKEAGRLAKHPALTGWLHRTTRNIAAQTIRTEARRRSRERQAAALNEAGQSETAHLWEELATVLDSALSDLNSTDCEAVLLRYFENRSCRSIAHTFGISEPAAQKRVRRAVDRLRKSLHRRGIRSGAAGLAAALSAHAVQPAPEALVERICAAVPREPAPLTPKSGLDPVIPVVLKLTAAALLVGGAIYLVSEQLSWRRDRPSPDDQPGADRMSGFRPAARQTNRRSAVPTAAVRSARQRTLALLRERWLELKPLGNAAIKEQNELARETSELLLCSEEAVELMAWLEEVGLRYGALRIKIEIHRLLDSARGPELRDLLVGLPGDPAASGRAGHYLIQDLCNVAGQFCPPEEFDSFYAGLRSEAYAQEALLGRNLTLMSTDPQSAVRSTVEILERDVHSLSKDDHLNRQFREDLLEDTDYPALETLLPPGSGKLGLHPSEWTPVDFGRHHLFQNWAKIDPSAATAYALSNIDRLHPRLFQAIAHSIPFENAEAVLEWVQEIPAGLQYDQAVLGALYYLMEHHPDHGPALAATVCDESVRKESVRILNDPAFNGTPQSLDAQTPQP